MVKPGVAAGAARQHAEIELAQLGDPEALRAALEDPAVVAVVLDGEGAAEDPDWFLEVDEVLASGRAPVVWLGDRRTQAELRAVLSRPYVRHLLPRGEGDLRRGLAPLLRALAQGQALGLEAWLGEGAQVVTRAVTGSHEKEVHLEALWEAMAEGNVHRRIARAAQLVTDELLVNAVYNAPVDAQGSPRFRHWPRTQPVALPPEGLATLRYAVEPEQVTVAVRDPYGSLTEEVLRRNLLRALDAGEEQIDQKEGGAGLGLYYVVSSTSRVAIRVVAGQETEFIGVFGLQGGYKGFAGAAKGIHLFWR
jgi:hypothetical protein